MMMMMLMMMMMIMNGDSDDDDDDAFWEPLRLAFPRSEPVLMLSELVELLQQAFPRYEPPLLMKMSRFRKQLPLATPRYWPENSTALRIQVRPELQMDNSLGNTPERSPLWCVEPLLQDLFAHPWAPWLISTGRPGSATCDQALESRRGTLGRWQRFPKLLRQPYGW